MSATTPITGHCLCGAVSYSIDAEPMTVILCHCEDCRRSSGAAFSINAVFPREALTLRGAALSTFETVGDDTGQKRERKFCGACGSQVMTDLAEMPEMAVMKAGTLDDPSVLTPELEIYTDSAHPWVHDAAAPERGLFPRNLPS